MLYNWSRRYFTTLSGTYSSTEKEGFGFVAARIRSENTLGELKATLVTGLFAMPVGVLQFIPGYHLFKDIFGIEASVTVGILASIYLMGVVYGLQHRGGSSAKNMRDEGEIEIVRGAKNRGKGQWHYDEIMICICLHFTFYALLLLFAEPKKLQVLGLHQTMGSPPGSQDGYDCAQVHNLSYREFFFAVLRWFLSFLCLAYPFTPAAIPWFLKSDLWEVTVWKRPYVCEDGYLLDEGYMDYSCEKARQQAWVPGKDWYWICGKDWTDGSGLTHTEYLLVGLSFCALGFFVFTNAVCYPRNFYTQFVLLGEFPKYYLTDKPKRGDLCQGGNVKDILDRRVNEQTGEIEYKVALPAEKDRKTTVHAWKTRKELDSDGVGEVYGERNGLYGKLYDSYRNGSTRERVDHFEQLLWANARLEAYQAQGSAAGDVKVGETPSIASEPISDVPKSDATSTTNGRKQSRQTLRSKSRGTSSASQPLKREYNLRKRKPTQAE